MLSCSLKSWLPGFSPICRVWWTPTRRGSSRNGVVQIISDASSRFWTRLTVSSAPASTCSRRGEGFRPCTLAFPTIDIVQIWNGPETATPYLERLLGPDGQGPGTGRCWRLLRWDGGPNRAAPYPHFYMPYTWNPLRSDSAGILQSGE